MFFIVNVPDFTLFVVSGVVALSVIITLAWTVFPASDEGIVHAKLFRRRNANAADNTDNNNKTAIINSSKSNKYITNIPKHSIRMQRTDAGRADNTSLCY